MKSIYLISDYFGKWPCWFDMFVESVRFNNTVNWCIYTDCPIPDNAPANIHFVSTHFDTYCAMVSDRLGIRFRPNNPYRICSLRPMLGEIHQSEIEGFDYFGWCDLDIIFGDIRSIYTDEILSYNVICTNSSVCSGHFTLVKNTPWLRTAYKNIRDWRGILENPGDLDWIDTMEEAHLSALCSPDEPPRLHLSKLTGTKAPDPSYHTNNFFRQEWVTPFTPGPWINGAPRHPEVWYWHNGVVSNHQDGARQFLYLHLMNFKARRWVDEELYGQSATWQDLRQCMSFTIDQLRARPPAERRVIIDRTGLHLSP